MKTLREVIAEAPERIEREWPADMKALLATGDEMAKRKRGAAMTNLEKAREWRLAVRKKASADGAWICASDKDIAALLTEVEDAALERAASRLDEQAACWDPPTEDDEGCEHHVLSNAAKGIRALKSGGK